MEKTTDSRDTLLGFWNKLRETWKNVPESKMKELRKAASLSQSLPQGDSYNTVVGCWFVKKDARCQATGMKIPFAAAPNVSHLPWIHKPIRKFFRGNQQQPQQSRSAACAMIPNQQNFTKQDERFNFSTIFSGCQIGQVHVIFKSDQAQWHSSWSSFLTES